MEEQTGYNGFTPSEYANELYRDATLVSGKKSQKFFENIEV